MTLSVLDIGFVSAVQPYEPDALNYFAAVEAAGGAVSEPAKNLLNAALTTTYNGLKYADYKAKLRFFWCPLSNFAGMRIPIKGNGFTNVGFVSGDYSLASGLTNNSGSSGKRLRTGVLSTEEANNNTTLMGGATNWTDLSLIGCGVGSDSFVIQISGAGIYADQYTTSGGGRITTGKNTPRSGFFISTRRSSTDFTFYQNETLVGQNTSSIGIGALVPTYEIGIGTFNYNNFQFASAIIGSFDAASFGQALTRDEEISFSRMLNAIRAGRAAL